MANIGEITRLQKELRAKAKAGTAGVGELTRLQKRIVELSRQSGKPKPVPLRKPKPVLRPKKGLPIGQRLPTNWPKKRGK